MFAARHLASGKSVWPEIREEIGVLPLSSDSPHVLLRRERGFVGCSPENLGLPPSGRQQLCPEAPARDGLGTRVCCLVGERGPAGRGCAAVARCRGAFYLSTTGGSAFFFSE